MFDTTLIASNPRRDARRKLATLPMALAVHAMAFGFVMVGQLWAVDQVPEMVAVPPLIVHILPPPGDGDGGKTGHNTRRAGGARVARPQIVQPDVIPQHVAKDTHSEPTADDRVPGSETTDPGSQVGDRQGDGLGHGPGVGDSGPAVVGPIHVGGSVVAPIPITRPAPRYPEAARRMRIQGVVSLEAVIDEEGSVTEVRLTRDPGFGCGQAALEAVQTWRYKPATLNGRAVAVYLTITVTFQLNGAE